MFWPPVTSQLSSENISLPSLLHRFSNISLRDDANRPLPMKVSSFARNSNCLVVIKDKVGYLPTIDAPATTMNTVFEILTNAKLIRDALKLESVIIVFDQAIYVKATEILWKNLVLYKTSSFEWEFFIPPQYCWQ